MAFESIQGQAKESIVCNMEPHISKSIQYTVNRGNKTINKQMITQRPIIAFKIEITYHVLRYHNSGYDRD